MERAEEVEDYKKRAMRGLDDVITNYQKVDQHLADDKLHQNEANWKQLLEEIDRAKYHSSILCKILLIE